MVLAMVWEALLKTCAGLGCTFIENEIIVWNISVVGNTCEKVVMNWNRRCN